MVRFSVARVAAIAVAVAQCLAVSSAAAAPATRATTQSNPQIGLASSVEGIFAFALAISVNLAAVMLASRRRASIE